MRWQNPLLALLLTTTSTITICGAPSLAYMAEQSKLDKAGADIQAGKYKEGAAEFKVLADKGCPFSQCIMGVMYMNGRGVDKNINTAISYFQKSAKQGYAGAEEHLGEIYQTGIDGAKKDPALATSWYRKAAFHGNGKAQLALGKIFMASNTPHESYEAKVWLAKATQVPGSIADEARKSIMTLPGMQDIVKAQDNFAFAMANLAVGGTLTEGGGKDLEGDPSATSGQLKPPADMPNALADKWSGMDDVEKSLGESSKVQ